MGRSFHSDNYDEFPSFQKSPCHEEMAAAASSGNKVSVSSIKTKGFEAVEKVMNEIQGKRNCSVSLIQGYYP